MGHGDPADHVDRQGVRDRPHDRGGDLQTLADHGEKDRDREQEHDSTNRRRPQGLQ